MKQIVHKRLISSYLLQQIFNRSVIIRLKNLNIIQSDDDRMVENLL